MLLQLHESYDKDIKYVYIYCTAQVQIEGDFLPCSFSILEDQPMDMLLGLDMLKRHQVCLETLSTSQSRICFFVIKVV